ncbi:MAG: Hsp70 family protein [Planctomycetota bacterium]
MSDNIFGIDLGTTYSEIAWVDGSGQAQVVSWQGECTMPSVVGVDAEGKLLVGTPARNQFAAFPDRTVRSVKRSMGTDRIYDIGGHRLSPPEVSALILKELARRAREARGVPVERVVITVPAFFSDSQRQVTKLAGEIAGLEVVRIINEPTAAALAYEGFERAGERLLLVFDLGGGTFDVSLVRSDGEITEVLASHGDVHLGGDDFDQLLADEVAERFAAQGAPDPRSDTVARARLIDAAEQAKRRLTDEVFTQVREEFLVRGEKGQPHHLDLRVTREAFEERSAHLIERCLDSVHRALDAAGKTISNVDEILLVGGATRMPMVGARLEGVTGLKPRRDLHPDLCVAQGAAMLAARLSGHEVQRVLVDITPYTFGVRSVVTGAFSWNPDFFSPVIQRNTPLPVTRSVPLATLVDNQTAWDVQVFQGESSDVRQNLLVGRFWASGFSKVPRGNEIVCRMHLDLNGLLTVEAIESRTGHRCKATLEGVTAAHSAADLKKARQRTAALWGEGEAIEEPPVTQPSRAESAGLDDATHPDAGTAAAAPDEITQALTLLASGRKLRMRMAGEDREDFDRLEARLLAALEKKELPQIQTLARDLSDLLYYVEGA